MTFDPVVDIIFKDQKLSKECNEERLLTRRHGKRRAGLLRRRLDQLRFALTLEGMRHVTGARCHELKGNRAGQFSVDLDHPHRLLFEAAHDPVPRRPDGGIDWNRITAIRILGIEDTHG